MVLLERRPKNAFVFGYRRRDGTPVNALQDPIAALVEACHRALDDLHRLDAVYPKIGIHVGTKHDETARRQLVLYRWRAAEPGNAEERCYIARVAEGGTH